MAQVTADGLTVGYAAMLEQFHPTEAVDLSAHAEAHGFSGVMAADHYQPWVPAQGQAAFVWNVLTALGERTTGDIGPGVTAPTFRWHPAVVAQASATLAAMYPGRHWLGLGSGEALNEHIVANYWPEAPERINRMFEAIEIIKKLFSSSIAGKDVKHAGQFYKLYLHPKFLAHQLLSVRSLEDLDYAARGVNAIWGHVRDFQEIRRGVS